MPDNNTRPVPEQEAVWDYPRPPAIELIDWRLKIEHKGQVLAETVNAVRVLETSHPPSYYFPIQDVDKSRLQPSNRTSLCEWKGRAQYWNLIEKDGHTVANAGWSYPNPARYELENRISFYANLVDACYVAGERVQPQAGDFYGGWITSWLVGPFKGAPGTLGW